MLQRHCWLRAQTPTGDRQGEKLDGLFVGCGLVTKINIAMASSAAVAL